MGPDQQIRAAEQRLFTSHGLRHGVSLAAAAWAPWLTHFTGYRAHLVELPRSCMPSTTSGGPGRRQAGDQPPHGDRLPARC